jgi:tryptophan synthase alpha subunit
MTEKIVLEMIKGGADFVELQIPFSTCPEQDSHEWETTRDA